MPQKTYTSRLLIILIIIVGFGGGYFYFSQLVSEPSVSISPFANKKDDLAEFKDFKLNTAILEDKTYRVLQVFGELPVIPGVTGKQNPFVP